MQLTVAREIFLSDRTMGRLFIDGEFFCYTLEHEVRPEGVKPSTGRMAIPAGTYKASVGRSTVFSRHRGKPTFLLGLANVPNFAGVRFFGSDAPDETPGVVIGHNADLINHKVHGTAEDSLLQKLTKDFVGVATVVNCPEVLFTKHGMTSPIYLMALNKIYGDLAND